MTFWYVAKRLDEKDKVNFKIYDVTAWLTNNRNTHIAKYFKKRRQSDNYICELIECNIRSTFFENHTQNVTEKLVPDPFLKN